MIRSIIISLLFASLLSFASPADDTGTVSIVGKNVDEQDKKTFGLTLVTANHTWIESETGNTNHYFKTKRGIYVQIAPNLVILRDRDNKLRVGQLNPINPDSAKKGDKGTGHADETGIAFTWEVQ